MTGVKIFRVRKELFLMYQRFHTALTAVCLSLLLAGCSASEPPLTQTIASDQELMAAGANRTSIRTDGSGAETQAVPTGSGEPSVDASYLDAGQAKATALEHAGISEENAILPKVRQDYDDGRLVYEVTFSANGQEYEYEIDASSGEILQYGIESDRDDFPFPSSIPDGAALSEEQARQIALDLVPGAGDNNIRIGTDYDDGRMIYEGKIVYQGMEYEFEIDASDGTVLEWDAEPQ